jgi:hypothetical protein
MFMPRHDNASSVLRMEARFLRWKCRHFPAARHSCAATARIADMLLVQHRPFTLQQQLARERRSAPTASFPRT